MSQAVRPENDCKFQPTRPLRGATKPTIACAESGAGISTHAPLAGRDFGWGYDRLSRLAISTHAPLAGRDSTLAPERRKQAISTHAPLAGRDEIQRLHSQRAVLISTHAPLAGRDRSARAALAAGRDFNPRAPCGARPRRSLSPRWSCYFNPRAPCGARPGTGVSSG